MGQTLKRLKGVAAFTLLYPAIAPLLAGVPNPMVPGAIVALHMVFPVMSGFFYGPVSGALTGCVGTALAWIVWQGPFDLLAIVPHLCMGLLAGFLGRTRSEVVASLAIAPGHILNICFYVAFGALTIEPHMWGVTILGLATESTVDIVVVILICGMLKARLYSEERF